MRCDRFLQRTEKRPGPSRREWLGGAMVAVAAGALWVGGATSALAAPQAKLWIGAASADITPDRSVPLTGYQAVRVSQGILSRCTANVLALESRQGDQVLDQAILVSCDLCVIRPGIQEAFRKHVAGRLPEFDINKLFLAATHTHTAPEILQERYDEKDYGVQIQARSPAPQTMLIQLATSCRQHAYYLPTPRAVLAGGYSAEATHNIVGPEGGQVLVDRTVQEINGPWSVSAAKP